MKNGWPTKTLADVCKVFADGDWVESKDQSPDGIRLIQTGNVGQGMFKDRAEKARYISEATFKRLRCTEIFRGDCLISRLPDPVGRSCILPNTGERMITAVDCTIVRFNPTQLLPAFFNFYSQSDDYLEAVDSVTTGTTRNRISRSNLGLVPIPVPALPEQQRVVDILDEAFESIATAKENAEENLQNARAMFESHLQSVFTHRDDGWKQKTLGEIATTFGRGKSKHRPRNEKRLYGGKYPFIQTGDIRNAEHFITRYSQTYSDAGLAQSKLWPEGTICITIAANIAETGILGFDACFPDSVIGLVANPKEAEVGFVEYLLQSFKVRLQAKGKGSAQANINMGTFENERFPFPSVTEQSRIVTELDKLREQTQCLESIYQRKLDALDELEKSLLHKAFAGELTAQPRRSVVIPFPARIPNITTTDLHAGILAIAYQLHEKNKKQSYFGHVKAEKIAHMIEAHLGIDLDRNAIKDAAGPNDYPHLKRVEHRAKKAGFFLFQESEGAGYRITKYGGFNGLVDRTRVALGDRNTDIDALLELMLPLKTKQAEILATVYAAWNNLLLDKQPIADEAIVFEARENWHPDKLEIRRNRFFDAIKWMRANGVIPTGKGKKVSSKIKKKK
jgi:restriction endonuclease S subunit